jgi:hypothetical protein
MSFAFARGSIDVEFAFGDWLVAHCVYGAPMSAPQAGETRCFQFYSSDL